MSELINFQQHLRTARLCGQAVGSPSQRVDEAAKTDADLESLQREAYKKGRREAIEEFKLKVDVARVLHESLFKSLQAAEEALCESVEAALPELIIAGVARIIPKWTPAVEDVRVIVHEMVSSVEEASGPLEIRLNETDKSRLDTIHDGSWPDFNGIDWVVDKSLRSGECVVSGRFGMIDGRFQSKLDHLRKDLN